MTVAVPRPSPGAPGVLFRVVPPEPELRGARLDACGFVGVAPRGPAWVPSFEPGRDALDAVEWLAAARRRSIAVTVTSWDEYEQWFGGFEGPGLLPYAVATFFQQGGRRAHVVRVVPVAEAGSGVASGSFPTGRLRIADGGAPVVLRARNEGAWGNGIVAELRTAARPLGADLAASTSEAIVLRTGTSVETGTLLLARHPGGTAMVRVVDVSTVPDPDRRGTITRARIVPALAAPALGLDAVRLDLVVSDAPLTGPPPRVDRRERHVDISLEPGAARFMADVLARDSRLVEPTADWAAARLELHGLDPARTAPFADGRDRYDAIQPDALFDAAFVPGDDRPLEGVHALLEVDDIGLVAVPDLYAPGLAPPEDVEPTRSAAGPEFDECVHVETPGLPATPPALPGLLLDPRDPADLRTIVDLQSRVVAVAETSRRFVALLDVPLFLDRRRALAWRRSFDSTYAAAYHPWPLVTRAAEGVVRTVLAPPSAVAAGIIAARELAAGVPTGPANVLASDVVALSATVSAPDHDELHPAGINVFLGERDGIRLWGARTLSTDPAFRQLSVRRLLVMLRLTLEREMQWTVFEPNGPSLHATIRHLLDVLLRRWWRQGAFAGATEQEAYFVRCDETTNPQRVLDAGMLVAEIGVAPSEPLEFITVELRCADTAVAVEVGRG